MPSLITKRGKTRWRASVQIQHLIRQKLFPDDTKKAHRAAIEWEYQTKKALEKELEGAILITSLTTLEWANEYLDFAEERFIQKTFKEKRSAFKQFLKTVNPDLPVQDVKPPECLKHLRKQAKERSRNAANKDRKNLAAGWTWGVKYIEGFPKEINPFLAVDKFPETRTPRYIPPEEDFWKVYQVAEGQDRVMLLTFLHLAARRNEIFRLTWDDVDFVNKRVRLWTCKRIGGHREADWLPMTNELSSTLRQWWQDRPVKDTRYVFVCLHQFQYCSKYYGKPFTVRQHLMKRLCEKANVKPFGYHAIRHLTATILYQDGKPVSLIQAVLRHKNPNTTTRYIHSLGLEQVRDGMEESLKGPAKVIQLNTNRAGNE